MPCSLVKSRITLLLFLIPVLASCDLTKKMNISGELVYTHGGKDIESISLESKTPSAIYRSIENVATIAHLTKVTDTEFVFEECSGMGDCSLKEFNLKTRSAKTLRSGIKPTYIPESNSLFYYNVPGSDIENWLFVVDKNTLTSPRKVAKAPPSNDSKIGWFYYVTPVVQSSPNTVLLVGEDMQLLSYDISQSILNPTGIKNCLPQFIRSNTQQLICIDTKSWDIYEIDLNSRHVELLSQLKGAHGFVYIPKYDTVIYGKTRLYRLMSETSDMWAYNFSTQEKVKIQSNSDIGGGFWHKFESP